MNEKKSFLGKIPLNPPLKFRERAEQGLTLDLIPLQDYLQTVLSVEPLIDAATERAPILCKSITSFLSLRADSLSVNILTKMTEDSEERVRFFAATALDVIDDNYYDKILGLKLKIKNNPDSVLLHKELGKTYFDFAQLRMQVRVLKNHYLDRAIKEFNKILDVESNDTEALYYKAIAYHFKGDTEKALEIYQKLINYAPDNCNARFGMAEIYYQQGLYEEVKVQCQNILRIGTSDQELLEIARFWSE